MNETEELRKKYEELTKAALAKAQAAEKLDARAIIVLEMAASYVADSDYFRKQGDIPRALAALSYAHGWLDCGARSKFFEVTDDRLFTVDSVSDEEKEDEQ